MKKSLKNTFVFLGGETILRITNRTPRILFWHGVDYIKNSTVEQESLSFHTFVQQINYLKKNYEIISIDEFYSRYSTKSFNGKEIVLTFDDGYKNNLTVVAPLLKSLSLPFTVFISTNNVSSVALFPSSIVRLLVFGSQLKKIEASSIGLNTELITPEQRNDIAKKLNQIMTSVTNAQVIQLVKNCLRMLHRRNCRS